MRHCQASELLQNIGQVFYCVACQQGGGDALQVEGEKQSTLYLHVMKVAACEDGEAMILIQQQSIST